MFSLNDFQISGAHEFDFSKGSNKEAKQRKLNNMSLNSNQYHNNSNSREILKKCKLIIHEQMIQINSLTEQNDQLADQMNQKQQANVKILIQIKTLKTQYSEAKNKNQTLHKQLIRVNSIVDQLTKKLQTKDNEMKLINNKMQLLQGTIIKLQQENQKYKTKCQLQQQTIELLNKQNKHIRKVVDQKDQQIVRQIEQLKSVNQILKRRNKVEDLDIMTYKNNDNYFSDKKVYCQPFYTVNQEPFRTIQLKKYKQFEKERQQRLTQPRVIQPTFSAELKRQKQNKNVSKDNVNAFSIQADKRQSRSPGSRIRKNISKPNYQKQLTEGNKMQRYIPSKTKTTTLNNSFNPQIQNQLFSIKKQIIEQYNRIEIKKQKINQERISHTLQQIQNKLEKMTKISALDDSQSQFQ